MRRIRQLEVALLLVAALAALPAAASAQTVNGAITGVVKDTSGAVVPDVAVTLRNIATDQIVGTTVTDADGEYAFRNLPPAKYEVQATKDGFQPVSLPDIEVTLGSQLRVDVTLPVGAQDRERRGGRRVVGARHDRRPRSTASRRRRCNQLPLLMNSGPRAAATFAMLMPGVSTGGGNNAFDARINGGLQSGDEASVDGVSMQQGFMSQGGMVSIFQDFPMSPDMVSEVKVLTSNYAPEYGSSTGGQIMAVTKSGGSSFHGAALRVPPRRLAARRRSGAQTTKPEFNKQQLRRQHRRPGQGARPLERQVKSYLLLRLRGLPADGRARTSRRCRFRRCRNAHGDFTRLARRQRQPDPDLRPGDDSSGRQRRATSRISSWAATATRRT